ncbi:MAG TPA: methyl-accepting chemotaxis protein [Gemmatimonadaceae bacterium]|nr:methyl-accepting chemotaxis protein [Gemmatimonadaceae bacterium]
MMHFNRLSNAWSRVLDERPASERIRLLAHLACVSLALLLIVGVGAGVMVSQQLAQVEQEGVPALRESRELRDILGATRDAIQGTDLAGNVARFSRADSLAERFHVLATSARLHEGHAAGMRSVDERFAAWYVQARRAAEQLPSGDDAMTSSAELAMVGMRAVRAMLSADIAATERDIAEQAASARRVQVASWIIMTLLALIGAVLLLSLGRSIDDANGTALRRATSAARALAEGRTDIDLPPTDDTELRSLHQALLRIGHTMNEHAAAAEALAEGRTRRLAGPTRADRVIVALGRVAEYEEELASTARRIADGDLTTTVTPRSSHDVLGRAHEEMTNGLVRLLGEVEEASAAIAATAERMHDAANHVVNGANEGAESVRRTADSLAKMTATMQGAATRAQSVENRAAESAATVQEGSAVLQESLGALTAVLREASVVDSIATDAGLLAVNAAIEAARAGVGGSGFTVVADEVRILAQQASKAAREINQLSTAGSASAGRSSALLGKLGPSIDDSAAMVRELAVSARHQADELMVLGSALGSVDETTRRTATGATQLRMSADALASHAVKLAGMLRSFRGRESKLAIA